MLRDAFFFRLRLGGLTLAASLALARALGLPREGNLVRQRHGAAVIFRLAGQAVVIELEAVVSRFSQEHSLPSETHRRLADVCSHRRVPALRSQTAPTKLVPRRWSCGPPRADQPKFHISGLRHQQGTVGWGVRDYASERDSPILTAIHHQIAIAARVHEELIFLCTMCQRSCEALYPMQR